MTCPRCQRRTIRSYGEQWCITCGTVETKATEAEQEAARVARTRQRYMGLRKFSTEAEE